MFQPHFNFFFLGGGGGGGGSILSEAGFRGKYSKMRHTMCIFLNIFVQDCSWYSFKRIYPADSIVHIWNRKGLVYRTGDHQLDSQR